MQDETCPQMAVEEIYFSYVGMHQYGHQYQYTDMPISVLSVIGKNAIKIANKHDNLLLYRMIKKFKI